ncbi:23kDa polypeptide of the oxygen-evolving complex of photosystem II [Dunaliella salina]|uniref:23kDa polypeptide of the oxygen-evolving complex of photosystem II n=1 Tax=Dunaliella salina TaxID=3046 RepID=A0ABQ7G190_DUNSA|nr:23kDa polypeptide of the oxygen-evolving complex of photosystem II [Dunaliella salina]|eukprot:KAF5828341.1 23kDa polypeptide of the oxygen-evolving complex of photosystem II [Dunaliella salina]
MAALLHKSGLSTANKVVAQANKAAAPRVSHVCRAQQQGAPEVDRRAALGMFVSTASLLAGAAPSLAAYGEGANVFGRVTNKSGFVPYAGDSFALLLPSKWNPSDEKEVDSIVLRYADNFDAVNNVYVVVDKTDKSSIQDYGSPEEFISQFGYLLGRQAWAGQTVSEGGFDANKVSSAALLGVATEKDKKGKTYYKFEILSRTADGNEGGRHQLVKATVSNGKLYLLKVQAGDKRWFKGTDKECLGVLDSFTVA